MRRVEFRSLAGRNSDMAGAPVGRVPRASTTLYENRMNRALRWLPCTLLAVSAMSCARSDGRKDLGTLTVLTESAPKNLDPRFTLDTQGVKIWRLIFAGLTRVGRDVSMEPDVATHWEVQDGGRTYVFHLRRDVFFHDGAPLTSADVEYTYASLLDPKVKSPFRGVFADRIDRIETRGPHVVVFRMKKPIGTFLADVALGIVPKHLAADLQAFPKKPVGAGPWVFASWREGEEVRLSANPRYHDGAPKMARLALRVVRNEVTRYLELKAGKADLVQNGLSPLYLRVIAGDPALKVVRAPSILTTYLAFNLRDPKLADVRVRRAIAHALDPNELIAQKLQGFARPATGLFAPLHWVYERDVARYPHDLARAKALLDEAGFPQPADGGPRLRLSYKTSTDKFRVSIARVLRSQLARVGIEIDLRPYEWGTFFEDLKGGNFQLCTLQWAELEEPDIAHWIFHSKRIPGAGPGGANRGAYRNARVDELLDLGQSETDRAKRKVIYSEVQKRLAEDLPYVFLWHEDNIAVARADLQELALMPNAKFDLLRFVRRGAATSVPPKSAAPAEPAR